MIIWLNGSFGAGKTTLAEALLKKLPNSIIFDPEDIGSLIHKTVPDSRSEDFQNFPMWREQVFLFSKNLVQQFGKDLIIPMTLVNSKYLTEIHTGLKNEGIHLLHFFLELDEATLRKRIKEQVLVASDQEKDKEVRLWRLAQVARCLSAISDMPSDTIFLDSGKYNPGQLVEKVLMSIC